MDLNNLTVAEWLGVFGFIGSFTTIVIAGYVQLMKLRGENQANLAIAKKDDAETILTNAKTLSEIADLYGKLRELNDLLVEERTKREDLHIMLDKEREDRILERQDFEKRIQTEHSARLIVESEMKLLKVWAETLVVQAEKLVNQLQDVGIKPEVIIKRFPFASNPDVPK